jgi:hypothetical protein
MFTDPENALACWSGALINNRRMLLVPLLTSIYKVFGQCIKLI